MTDHDAEMERLRQKYADIPEELTKNAALFCQEPPLKWMACCGS